MSDIEQTFVCVEEEEFEKLKKNQDFLFSIQANSKERLNLVRMQVEQEFKEKLSRVERRQVEYQRFIYDLNGDLRSLEIETQRRFDIQNQKFDTLKTKYLELLQMARNEYLSLFNEQALKITELIRQESHDREVAVTYLEKKIESVLLESLEKKERVRLFLSELNRLLEEVKKIPYQFYPNNKMQYIERNIKDALYDFSLGFAESSLGLARIAYRELVELREKALENEQEFIIISCALNQNITLLLQKVALSNKITMRNDTQEINFEVDYWANDSLKLLELKLKELKEKLSKTKDLEKLKELLEKLNLYEKDLNSIIEIAKESILLSQIRFNISQKIVEILKSNLFSLIKSGYDDNDCRNYYFMKFINKNKIEIAVKVLPLKNSTEKNKVVVEPNYSKIDFSKLIRDFMLKSK